MALSNKKITGSMYDSCGNVNGFVSKMDKSYTHQNYYNNSKNSSNSSLITYIPTTSISSKSCSNSIKKRM